MLQQGWGGRKELSQVCGYDSYIIEMVMAVEGLVVVVVISIARWLLHVCCM